MGVCVETTQRQEQSKAAWVCLGTAGKKFWEDNSWVEVQGWVEGKCVGWYSC